MTTVRGVRRAAGGEGVQRGQETLAFVLVVADGEQLLELVDNHQLRGLAELFVRQRLPVERGGQRVPWRGPRLHGGDVPGLAVAGESGNQSRVQQGRFARARRAEHHHDRGLVVARGIRCGAHQFGEGADVVVAAEKQLRVAGAVGVETGIRALGVIVGGAPDRLRPQLFPRPDIRVRHRPVRFGLLVGHRDQRQRDRAENLELGGHILARTPVADAGQGRAAAASLAVHACRDRIRCRHHGFQRRVARRFVQFGKSSGEHRPRGLRPARPRLPYRVFPSTRFHTHDRRPGLSTRTAG